ncbi:unnamed protein product [Parascedosporium putredinis]|uniref:CAP-Gly domain-containing protein n=1 Tax=Parascedosporium putredinis TaxID=1442378 RepID=A0A9P1H637_9PEZI|nr:unnamed protein product [Parascedosporium putredinis]CAI7998494.1 unnamed protein product [Parascedosporium putredinis]
MSAGPPPRVGQRVSYDGAVCTVRYVGDVAGTSGVWLGVEWDDPTRGKHDGSHKGTKYFKCLSNSPTAASFVRPSRPAEKPQGFLSALHEKYASEVDATTNAPVSSARLIEISGKVVEEVGFNKIRSRLARVEDLKIVILDGMRVSSTAAMGLSDGRFDSMTVAETCPKIIELDLSRNLFDNFGLLVEVCGQLPDLRSLRINGNRFQDVLRDHSLEKADHIFTHVKELALEETLLRWDDICHITARFGSLASLHCGTNQLTAIPTALPKALSSSLTVLNLEFNGFKALSDVTMLSSLVSLRNLHLKGNSISAVTSDPSIPISPFPPSIHYVDLSYNQIPSWDFVDSLQSVFPGLTALRLAHNPIYEIQDQTAQQESRGASSEEAHMITIARLSQLKTLNFVSVTPNDRANAEMFYLSRIAKQLAAVAEDAGAEVLRAHPRYAELCEEYGEPDIIRRKEVNPDFLEARLVTVTFKYLDPAEKVANKAHLGNGEWDPAADLDEKEGDSSDEEDEIAGDEMEWAVGEQGGESAAPKGLGGGGDQEAGEASGGVVGRWIKREQELLDSPRALRFCVDGQEAKIRVEVK